MQIKFQSNADTALFYRYIDNSSTGSRYVVVFGSFCLFVLSLSRTYPRTGVFPLACLNIEQNHALLTQYHFYNYNYH
jgi:hypothetical protein